MSASERSVYEEIIIESTVNASDTVDLRVGVERLDYYEDVLSPTITAKILVTTTGDVINGTTVNQGLPLRGGERVSIRIKENTKTNVPLDFSREGDQLYVSSISNVITTENTETFVLNLCSREAISNETSRVPIKFPTSSPISTSVAKIIKDYLAHNKPVDIDKTMNKYGFIGNMRKPFTILTWLASKGVPEMSGDGTAGYFFYQTKEGYHFKSIDKLIAQKPVATYYAQDAVGKGKEQQGNDRIILSYNVTRNNDLLKKLRLGTYSSQRSYFNPLNFSFTHPEKGKFSLKDYVSDSNNLGQKLSLPPIKGSERNLGDIPSRMITGIVDLGTLEEGVSVDENADPFKYQSQTIMRYNLLFTQSISATLPLNSNLRAGDVIECNFPKTTVKKVKEFDDNQQSGLYMIKELCHHYDKEGSYTAVKLIRDTFGKYGVNNKK